MNTLGYVIGVVSNKGVEECRHHRGRRPEPIKSLRCRRHGRTRGARTGAGRHDDLRTNRPAGRGTVGGVDDAAHDADTVRQPEGRHPADAILSDVGDRPPVKVLVWEDAGGRRGSDEQPRVLAADGLAETPFVGAAGLLARALESSETEA